MSKRRRMNKGERFAKAFLRPYGFETVRAATVTAWLIVDSFRRAGLGSDMISRRMATCAKGKYACGLVSCTVCDRTRRIAVAIEVQRVFAPLIVAGHDVYFLTVVPWDSFMRLRRLPTLDWTQRRREYQKRIAEVLQPFGGIGVFGPDVDIRPGGQCCLHLHGIVALPPGTVSFRRITELLVGQFWPADWKAAKRPARPVQKTRITMDTSHVATYLIKSRFSVASAVRKRRGIFLGKREIPIRQFFSQMTPRGRLIRIGFNKR